MAALSDGDRARLCTQAGCIEMMFVWQELDRLMYDRANVYRRPNGLHHMALQMRSRGVEHQISVQGHAMLRHSAGSRNEITMATVQRAKMLAVHALIARHPKVLA